MNHTFNYRADGLQHCKVCNGGEGSLPSECPGRKMTADEGDAVMGARLNFSNRKWWVPLQAEPRTLEFGAVSKGETDEPGCTSTSDAWTAGINVGTHGNAIECHAATKEKAEALRDSVFAALPLQAAQAGWQPIETAPKDGTSVLGFCVHAADPYHLEDSLTDYGARVEGLGHVADGIHAICWDDAREESDGHESPSYWIPAGWMHSADNEQMANPTHWMPLPAAPATPPKELI